MNSCFWKPVTAFFMSLPHKRLNIMWFVSFATGFSVPQSGIEPRPLQWKPRMLTTMPSRNSLNIVFCTHCYSIIQWQIHQSVQFSCSVVSDSATLCTTACQASLTFTNSWSLLKLMSVESVMPSNHLKILCCPPLLLPSIFPNIRVFQMSQLFASGGRSTGVSASTSVLPMNIQNSSPLGWIGWISLQSKGLSRVFSNTTVQRHQFFGTQLSL